MRSRQLRTLIVDDSADDAVLLTAWLKEAGFDIASKRVETESELTEAIASASWDVVLCDHQLPELDANEALEIVRGQNLHIPLILVSGEMAENDAACFMSRGATDFVSKNNLSRLAPAIEREMEKSRVRFALEEANHTVGKLKLIDQETGLANREYLLDYLGALLEDGKNGAVVLVEIRRFRHFVKAVGEETGQKFLNEMALRLYEYDMGGLIGRIGDNMLAFVATTVEENPEKFLRQICEGLKQPLDVEGQEYHLYCRVGGSLFPEHGRDPTTLLNRAESALQQENTARRFALYRPEIENAQRQEIAIERALYDAVRNAEFVLHYQPQFSLAEGKIIGVEALIRWRRPGFGMVPPAQFIQLLEETHLIVQVGDWVCRTACETARAWQKKGNPPLRMAINLSAIQFGQPELVDKIRGILAETGLDPALLELEITENVAMFMEEEVSSTLHRLKKIGVSLAIDDFGTGYSSLTYLRRFPVDRLKIDRSFVQDMLSDPAGKALVSAIRRMASCLNLQVIAEGVETEEQASFLAEIGCEEAQGYYFGKPMPAEEIEALLAAL